MTKKERRGTKNMARSSVVSESRTHLGSEIKSESVWCYQGSSLISFSKLFPQREVEHVGGSVIVHGESSPLLSGTIVIKSYC